jgi:ArsR family transcriptional regulator
MVKEEQITRVLKAIGDPKRRQILKLLTSKGCCSIDRKFGLCACDIEERVKLSQPTVSHHMKILADAGLVEGEKQGQWMWYRRNEKAIAEFVEALGQAL